MGIQIQKQCKIFHGTDFLDQLVSQLQKISDKIPHGGTTKDGFDCSGLMCTTFSKYSITTNFY
jgi:cell wall-associated NlpC family hydrolase